jgi:hypothetical protein
MKIMRHRYNIEKGGKCVPAQLVPPRGMLGYRTACQ